LGGKNPGGPFGLRGGGGGKRKGSERISPCPSGSQWGKGAPDPQNIKNWGERGTPYIAGGKKKKAINSNHGLLEAGEKGKKDNPHKKKKGKTDRNFYPKKKKVHKRKKGPKRQPPYRSEKKKEGERYAFWPFGVWGRGGGKGGGGGRETFPTFLREKRGGVGFLKLKEKKGGGRGWSSSNCKGFRTRKNTILVEKKGGGGARDPDLMYIFDQKKKKKIKGTPTHLSKPKPLEEKGELAIDKSTGSLWWTEKKGRKNAFSRQSKEILTCSFPCKGEKGKKRGEIRKWRRTARRFHAESPNLQCLARSGKRKGRTKANTEPV